MDPFGYEMARDAAGGAGLPNVRTYTQVLEFGERSPPDERYDLSFARRRYVRRGGVFGRWFDGPSFVEVLDELRQAQAPSPVDTPVYVAPATIRRRKQKQPRRC